MRTAIYTRTAMFASASVTGQVDACRSYADARGWQVASHYADTGTALDVGPELHRLMFAVERGEVDAVVTADVTRLTRKTFDNHPFVRACREHHVKLAFANEGDTCPGSKLRIEGKQRRVECPMCGRRILTRSGSSGKLYPHKAFPECPGCGKEVESHGDMWYCPGCGDEWSLGTFPLWEDD